MGLLLISGSVSGMRGLRWFGWAVVAAALELVLVLLQPSHPAAAVAFTARLLLLIAAALLTQGAAEFTSPRSSIWGWSAVLIGLFAAVEIYTLQGNRHLAALAFLAAFSAQLLTALLLLLAHNEAGERAPCRVAGVMVAATVALCVWGVAASLPRSVFMVAYLVLSAGLAFSFVWMLTARLRNQLEQQARTDVLTGLLNRRALEINAQRELAASCREQMPLAVLAMDVDHFKSLNDNFGHAAGDVVLAAAARMLAQCLRNSDHLARLGGEEFVAVLPARDAERAAVVAERLRSRVQELRVNYDGHALALTVSIGIAIADPGDTWASLLQRADVALYDAKRAGRNCIRAAAAAPSPSGKTAHGIASASA